MTCSVQLNYRRLEWKNVAVETAKLSLEEFMHLPDRPGVDLELWDGEVVEVPRPTGYHMHLQEHISLLLKAVLEPKYFIRVEFSYSFASESHRADVGAVPIERWKRDARRRDLPSLGSPTVLVEILSPSNTTLELNRLRELCFRNGCLQFWEVDPDLKIVTVFEPDRDAHIYRAGSEIPLRAVTGSHESVPVDSIFAD